jgi:uncharacterized 2Fe-2S/4Fe-4S cluster protein (DUF4445 family)
VESPGKYGISVDIGTTNITLQLTSLGDGSIREEIKLRNPQREFGEEVISRIDFARKRDDANVMMNLVRKTVNDGITRLTDMANCDRESVNSVVIVGNTVMHHLFFGLSTSTLLKPPYLAEHKGTILKKAAEVGIDLHANATCYSPPVIESYVGPDAVAMMLASGFFNSEMKLVSIDIGTNTEIAAINENEIWIASAASGPAFEGMSLECGTSGDVGAISRVSIDSLDSRPHIDVIGDEKPTGICGTGVISAIASMLESGILFSRGSFNREMKTPWLVTDTPIVHYVLATASESATESNIVLTQPDIRMIQQSKSSIRSALGIVLKQAKLNPADIDTLYLTGVFGSDLNISDAIQIGLLPDLVSVDVKQVKGGASIGANLMHHQNYQKQTEEIASIAKYIELTENPEFKKRFTENLAFPNR